MTTEARFTKLFAATPAQLAKIDEILEGKATAADPTNSRLLTLAAAARELGVSRQTVWRMVNEGRLPVVEIRMGSLRVPVAALTALVQKAEVKHA